MNSIPVPSFSCFQEIITCVWSFFPFPPQQWFCFFRVRKRKILQTWWWGEIESQRNSRKKDKKYDRWSKLTTTLEEGFPWLFNIRYTTVHIFQLWNFHSKNSLIMSIHLTSLSSLKSSVEKYWCRCCSFHSIQSIYGSNFAPGSSLSSFPNKFFNSKCETDLTDFYTKFLNPGLNLQSSTIYKLSFLPTFQRKKNKNEHEK